MNFNSHKTDLFEPYIKPKRAHRDAGFWYAGRYAKKQEKSNTRDKHYWPGFEEWEMEDRGYAAEMTRKSKVIVDVKPRKY